MIPFSSRFRQSPDVQAFPGEEQNQAIPAMLAQIPDSQTPWT